MTAKNIKNYTFIEIQLCKLSEILCKKILEYKKDVLEAYSIFDIAVYKNLSNLFQNNNQHVNYEFIKHFYDNFHNQYFRIYKSSPIIKKIFPKIVNIMKYQWKNGDDTPMEPEECIEISKNVLDKEFDEFFEVMFNTIFYHSYIFNYIVENYDNVEELQSLNFKNNTEYKIILELLRKKYKLNSVIRKEKVFYKKASEKILSEMFIFKDNALENSYTKQKHVFYISGIKLKQFQYKLAPGIIIRNPKINEIKITNNHWDSGYDKKNCVIEYSYKYKDFGEVIHSQHVVPLVLKLAFKNCARIKEINSYLEFGKDGKTTQQISKGNYYGNIPVIVPDELISELPKLIKLCAYYTNNAEKDFDNLGFLSIALDFYSQALDKVHPTHKIAYACLALEALYNTSSERVIHQIAQRCSTILSPILNKSQSEIKK